MPIHREAPSFVEQATEQQVLVTGIKVSDTCIVFYRIVVDAKAVIFLSMLKTGWILSPCFIYFDAVKT